LEEEQPMTNLWANRARMYYREYRPAEYQAISDKDTFFRELGETAQAQIDTVYRQIRRPELGDDRMAMMQAEETIRDLIYPPPEPGSEDGWESIVVSTEEYDQAANLPWADPGS
jgi:hypothetical protein